MTKAELKALIATKKGFVREISDKLTQDSIAGDTVEKRVITVEHLNTDGTAGITFVYYLHETKNDVAKFYNVAPVAFDNNELSNEAKKKDALEKYLGSKYLAYFINRSSTNNWAEADVYTLDAGTVTKKTVLVYKQGSNPVIDADVI